MNRHRAANPSRTAHRKEGESDAGQQRLGLVTGKTLAGGKGTTDKPCPYCGEIGGHTAQCPVVS